MGNKQPTRALVQAPRSVSFPSTSVTPQPQGRLTLTSATPYLSTNVTAATTVYYTPAVGSYVPLFDGSSSWSVVQFSETSQAFSDTTKSPAATVASNNYDLFVWNDTGTIRCTRGPPWATGGGSATARGAGAGSTALTPVDGFYLNANDITNGPVALTGTYVGTIRVNASNQTAMMFGTAAGVNGGEGNLLGVWNLYNQQLVCSYNFDNFTTGYSPGTGWNLKHGFSVGNETAFVIGMPTSSVRAGNSAIVSASSSAAALITIGLDSTTAMAAGASCAAGSAVNTGLAMTATLNNLLGYHFIAALEQRLSGTTVTLQYNSTSGANYRGMMWIQILM